MKSVMYVALAALVSGVLTGCSPKETTEGPEAPKTPAPSSQGTGEKSAAPSPQGSGAATPSTGVTLGSIKVGDKAVCAVCAVKEGKVPEPEEAKATIDYKGKTYGFCNLDEKAEFISNPSKYAK